MSGTILFAICCGILGVIYAVMTAMWVSKQDAGSAKMQDISNAVKEGAYAFLAREYKSVAVVAVILVILISAFGFGTWTAIGFVVGTVGSALAGFVGMWVTVRANVRTTQAAHKGLQAALGLAFKGGSVTGVMVVGLGIIGLSCFYFTAKQADPEMAFHALVGLGFGCSLMSVFARIAGGIYTKAADVGADLVGKVEAGIPEDDPRNPAVIADNVGDNVGDCAGMAADLFETYVVTIVATMVLAAILFDPSVRLWLMMLPLAIGAICIATSVAGTYYVKLGPDNNIMWALYKGLLVTGGLSVIGILVMIAAFAGFHTPLPLVGGGTISGGLLFASALVGLGVTGGIVVITEYYTSTAYRPVRSIAQSSTTGHGTNVIQGLAISMEATAAPVVVICIGIVASYMLAGLFGIAIAATTMLSL